MKAFLFSLCCINWIYIVSAVCPSDTLIFQLRFLNGHKKCSSIYKPNFVCVFFVFIQKKF